MVFMRTASILAVLSLYFITFPLLAKTANHEFIEKIETVFSNKFSANAPGCSVGVMKDNQLIFAKGYGLANLEHAIPLSADSVFRMASVSKQFTATAVLLLADEGLIDLQEDIRTYLPELADYGSKVTVNAMLGHFAGMGDYDMVGDSYEGKAKEANSTLKSAAGGEFRLGNEDYLSIDEFYQVVKKLPLKRKPDTQMEYSNFAYFLLSMLVEEKSGMTLREYSDKNIFKPLGMKHTFFSDDANEIVKNRASGYAPLKEGGYETNMTNLFWVGDGGLHTSITELLLWDQQFYIPKLGKNPQEFLKKMLTPNSKHELGGSLYANGQFVKSMDKITKYSHSGGWLGTSTYYARIPEEKLSVVVLCNDVSQNPGKYSNQILDSYFN
jgi:CubicO group peptidase (beta-lactamase class C family)